MSKFCFTLLTVAALASMTTALPAQANTNVGVLSCQSSASLRLIIGSHQKLRCSFTPNNGGPVENYAGYINRLGLDVGITAGGVMAWGVIAPTAGLHHGALAGKYVGASSDIALGLGVGANVLVGGSHRSFALQPLSVTGQAGVNLALGVAGLTLLSAP